MNATTDNYLSQSVRWRLPRLITRPEDAAYVERTVPADFLRPSNRPLSREILFYLITSLSSLAMFIPILSYDLFSLHADEERKRGPLSLTSSAIRPSISQVATTPSSISWLLAQKIALSIGYSPFESRIPLVWRFLIDRLAGLSFLVDDFGSEPIRVDLVVFCPSLIS